uniref:Beta-hexosaminidase n=1 Tax=Panagrolaimus superbus TaxID=310955 RepID=A0A914YQ99_9BILA
MLIPILFLVGVLSSQTFSQEFKTAPPPGLRTDGGIWPLPQNVQYLNHSRSIGTRRSRPIQIILDENVNDCDILKFTRKTYLRKWLLPFEDEASANDSTTLILTISVQDGCPKSDEFPQQGMDEKYSLSVPKEGNATLEAKEVWGALRGLETFSQLVFLEDETYYIQSANIHDFPRFSVRGILIDTSRHYLPPQTIRRQIDLMAQNKMNVLHWHIVDIESFPYISTKFPELSGKGAFTPRHVYDPKTVQNIIHYARLRGIRVMVEIDTPGHTGSWKGQPGFLADCSSATGEKVAPNILDPTKKENYKFLAEFFTEILEVFPEKFLHLGGDEVEYWTEACWRQNPEIRRFMKLHGFPDNVTALEDYYFSKLQQLLAPIAQERRQVFWQEVFDNNIPEPNSIIHIWKGGSKTERAESLAKVTAAGHQAILSSCWYLNYIHYGDDWKTGGINGDYYYCDPQDFNGTDAQKALVLGGIATMWAEMVDSTNIEARLWPRASAVAERLWSDPLQQKMPMKHGHDFMNIDAEWLLADFEHNQLMAHLFVIMNGYCLK